MHIRHEHELPGLTRDQFRAQALERDGHRCVWCGRTDRPLDVHHIIERRLFRRGGYLLENAATLCDDRTDGCHTRAEQTLISPDDLRERIGITTVALPEALYHDVAYTKWGDMIHPDGTRSPGPLFWDDSVQRILQEGGVLGRYDTRVKYPRTYHLPGSPGMQSDDRMMDSSAHWAGQDITVSIKLDGANTTLYADGLHGRSVRGRSHPSQSYVRSLQPTLNLDPSLRAVVENLQAAHTLRYAGLENLAYGLSIWDGDTCLSTADTALYFAVLDLPTPPVVYQGPYVSQAHLDSLAAQVTASGHEGVVARLSRAFTLREFPSAVGKHVGAEFARRRDAGGHDWHRQTITPNERGPGTLRATWTRP